MTNAAPDLAPVRRRLAGVVLRSPLVGVTSLGGRPVAPGLRAKLECLQVGGSAWFRGTFHALARSLGAHKEVVAHGDVRAAIATVTAAAVQRIPSRLVLTEAAVEAFGGPDAVRGGLPAGAPVEVETGADDAAAAGIVRAARARGASCWPRLDGVEATVADPDVYAGLATIGAELAEDMASDVAVVAVAPAWLVAPVREGLAAGGRADCRVVAAPEDPDASWQAAVLRGLRCHSDVAAAFAAALDVGEGPTVIVLGA